MATLGTMRTDLALRLRDTGNATWSTTIMDALINQGIDALADFYPREIVQTIGTVSSSTTSYSATSFTSMFRLDVYTSAGSYREEYPRAFGEGANSGWELHGGVIYLGPSWALTTGDTLRAWGYGRYTQLAATSSVTDVDQAGIFAVLVYAQANAIASMLSDRAALHQWQAQPGNTDVTLMALNQAVSQLRSQWRDQQTRLRRVRKR